MHQSIVTEKIIEPTFEKSAYTYLIKRIQKCFYKLEEYLDTVETIDEDEIPGIFIQRINTVLNELSDKRNIETVKPQIEKILFQAITIAKVSDKSHNLDIISSSKQVLKAIQDIEETINENDSFFKYDYISSLLSILERRVNSSILYLIYKVFSDPFCVIKQLLQKCGDLINIPKRNPNDLLKMTSELDNSTDILIQIGIFAISCCSNTEDVTPLKCCLSSLELLDSDLVPAITKFYLDPTSCTKKSFLKLLINHWISEILNLQKILHKIIDPSTYAQTVLEASINILQEIRQGNTTSYMESFNHFLNGLNYFSKYVNEVFMGKAIKECKLSSVITQLNQGLKECNACLIFFKKENIAESSGIVEKMLKRCEIVIKHLKSIQFSICELMNINNAMDPDNVSHILSKTKHSLNLTREDYDIKNDDLDYLFSANKIQFSFYNIPENKALKTFCNLKNLVNVDETNIGNTIMDLTNILDNFIETLDPEKDIQIANSIWEETNINIEK
ncbi:uncharacterized protein LOC126833686 isoform X2 [Adelges cooleyi]|nr:uncharacterized protein LOC126833686 isoform X2 [Adelges cooleyi]XP_050421118.1 uncharacterized protein LOC126833686 isoform X2 [Adelges cooleyi]